jgi:predicted DNA-binding transcriptional regulator AlpA
MIEKPLSGYSRLSQVCEQFRMSPTTVWRKVKDGTFVKPLKLSEGITAWKNSELAEWERDPMNFGSKKPL